MDEFSINSSRNGGVTVATVVGRIDSVTAITFEEEIDRLLHKDRKVVLDIKDVVYISSAGVRAIVSLLKKEKKMGANLKLACMPHVVENVLKMVGMLHLVETYPTVDEAIASF